MKNRIYVHNCLRCKYQFASKKEFPKNCGHCKAPYWWKQARKYIKKKEVSRWKIKGEIK